MANKILCNTPQALSSVAVLYVAPGDSAAVFPSLLDFDPDFGQSAGNLLVPTGSFSFRSANSFICTVDGNGVVTGNHVGQTTVGIAYAGLVCDVTIIVTNAALKVGPINESGLAIIGPA